MTHPTGLQQAFPPHRSETEEERQARIRREAAIVAEAEAAIDAGFGLDDDDLEAWLDELDRDPDAPLPTPRKGGPALR